MAERSSGAGRNTLSTVVSCGSSGDNFLIGVAFRVPVNGAGCGSSRTGSYRGTVSAGELPIEIQPSTRSSIKDLLQ